MAKIAAAMVAVLLTASSMCDGGDTSSPPLNPRQSPLAVLRVPQPAAAEAVFASRPAGLAGVAGRDWNPRLPGLSRVAGVRAFLARLDEAGAEDLWFCLVELNRSALGWRWRPAAADPAAAEAAAEALLREAGFDPARAVVSSEPLGDGSYRVVFAPNGNVVSALREGGAAKEGGWRASLAAFMGRSGDGIGLWLNPRPLSGIAAMVAGVDLRSLCAGLGVDLPAALVAWIFPNGDNLGFRLRADGFLPPEATATPSVVRTASWSKTAVFPSSPLFRLDFRLFGLQAILTEHLPPAPPGVDWLALFPGTASFALWRDGDRMKWAFAGDAADGEGMFRAFRRLVDWLDPFSRESGGGIAISPLAGGDATCAFSIGTGPAALIVGARRNAEGGGMLFLTNTDLAGLPRFSDAFPAPGPEPVSVAVEWDARLDARAVETVANDLPLPFGMLARFGPEVWPTLVGEGEMGGLRLENGGLTVDSPRGALAWMLPAAAFYVEEIRKGMQPNSAALAAARLRFLLRAAGLSRFRTIGPDGLTPAAMPASLSALAFSDADGAAWLDNALPGFPGLGRPNGRAVSLLAEGMRIDGYGYAIDTAAGWHIVATPAGDDLPALRIDADGLVSEFHGSGEWQPYHGNATDWVAEIR